MQAETLSTFEPSIQRQQSGRRGRRASENRKAKRAFQKVDYYNKSTANWTQKKSKAQDC